MKIVQASDLHQNVAGLEVVVNVAKIAGCPLFFAGDWFAGDKAVMAQAQKRKMTDPDALTSNEEAQAEILAQAKKSYEQFNQLTKGVDLYLIPGNHDFKIMYDIVKGHFLDQKPAEIKGVKFAGAINSFEGVRGINPENVVDLSDDVPVEQLVQMFKENGTIPEGTSQEQIIEFLKQNLPALKEQIPVYKRLKEVNFDYFLLHKGPQGALTNNQSSGIGTSSLIKEKKCNVLCGHFHGGLVERIGEVTGIRSGPNVFYTVEINEKDKGIDYVDVYKIKTH